MREFNTGANRDSDTEKNDFEGFYDPLIIEEFGNYMTKHRKQADGKLRDSDNWKRGIPKEVYIKSLWRHFLDVWAIHRGYKRIDKSDSHEITIKEAICACLFNLQGYLYEVLKKEDRPFIEKGEENICEHCGGDKKIRNPKGYCDHLYYPESCEVCKNMGSKI